MHSRQSLNTVAGEAIDITVTIEGVGSERGQLLVYLHDNSHSYHSDDNIDTGSIEYFRKRVLKPVMPVSEALFRDVPAGRYAVMAIHDEDADGRFDRMLFPFTGMPSEPYGISNDSFAKFAKGAFEDALVEFSPGRRHVRIRLASHLQRMVGR